MLQLDHDGHIGKENISAESAEWKSSPEPSGRAGVLFMRSFRIALIPWSRFDFNLLFFDLLCGMNVTLQQLTVVKRLSLKRRWIAAEAGPEPLSDCEHQTATLRLPRYGRSSPSTPRMRAVHGSAQL